MTYLFNKPADFADELAAGFAAANARWVRPVPGGVVAARPADPGSVAVVIGGGSGHYPAFAGLVGPGLASGAVLGNLFASPSAQQIISVARAANSGGGILFSYGNYAGDVLNFTRAERQLARDGIPCRQLQVTDDISSAPAAEISKRRGIAGDLIVFKVAGAAAAEGASLDEVWRLASHANDRTRTLGVAFAGCTMPGADQPLFSVPPGTMAVGMGIHGEPGIRDLPLSSADDLADLLMPALIDERPEGSGTGSARVALILNGLGSVKYEELFVVYRRIDQRLRDNGITPVDPDVGEFVTSFDMAGLSLTFCWLDEELERLWGAAASTPAYRKGSVSEPPAAPGSARHDSVVSVRTARPATAGVPAVVPVASAASRAAATLGLRAFRAAAACIDAHVAELGRLDSVAGDGDHGRGMQRGVHAAVSAAERASAAGAGLGTLVQLAGDDWADQGGGTSGALWGLGLRALGTALGDEEPPSAAVLAVAISEARTQIEEAGGARVGDKTMLDALAPLITSLTGQVQRDVPLHEAFPAAADAAAAAAQATQSLSPAVGRARPLAAKSVGSPDPGAVSLALICQAVAAELTNANDS